MPTAAMCSVYGCAVSVKPLSSPSRMTDTEGRGSGAGEIGRGGVAELRWFAKSGMPIHAQSPPDANNERPAPPLEAAERGHIMNSALAVAECRVDLVDVFLER